MMMADVIGGASAQPNFDDVSDVRAEAEARMAMLKYKRISFLSSSRSIGLRY